MSKIKLVQVLCSGLFFVHICGYAMDQKPSPVQAQTSVEAQASLGDTASKDDAAQEAALCAFMDQFEADYFGDEVPADEPALGVEHAHDQPVVASSSSSSSKAIVPANKKSAFGINGIMQCYFSSRDNISAYLIDYINDAQYSIYIAMYQLRLMDIARALARAKVRGVDVWVICDHCTKNDRAIQFLITCGINVFVWNSDTPKALMHDKFALIDGDIVWNGSYNWTPNANNNNCENVMVVKNEEMYEMFFDEFCDELLSSSSRLQMTQDPGQQNPKKRKRNDETSDDVH